MPGLTAKVFRTFHATTTVKDFLARHSALDGAPTYRKEFVAKFANLKAAITCNHKRTPPKTWAESLAKRQEAVKKLRAAKPDLQKLDRQIEAREAALEKLLQARGKVEAEKAAREVKQGVAVAGLEARLEPVSPRGSALPEKHEPDALRPISESQRENAERAKHLERIAKAQERLAKARMARERALTTYTERLEKAKRERELAKLTGDYNLNTSLKNYIDPREYKSWGKRVDYDWRRLYTRTLQRKFNWAK